MMKDSGWQSKGNKNGNRDSTSQLSYQSDSRGHQRPYTPATYVNNAFETDDRSGQKPKWGGRQSTEPFAFRESQNEQKKKGKGKDKKPPTRPMTSQEVRPKKGRFKENLKIKRSEVGEVDLDDDSVSDEYLDEVID